MFKSTRGFYCIWKKIGLQRRFRAESPKFFCCIGAFWGMQRLWKFKFAALAIFYRCSVGFLFDCNLIIWKCSLMEKILSSEISIFSNVVIKGPLPFRQTVLSGRLRSENFPSQRRSQPPFQSDLTTEFRPRLNFLRRRTELQTSPSNLICTLFSGHPARRDFFALQLWF